MYLDALLDFYRHKSGEETLRVDELAELDRHGLSLDKWERCDEEIGETIYVGKNNIPYCSG
tara:strand:- start:152 stop:334 length:183 start_codon:yes stop_codon:yes gene_type:complete